MGREVNSALFLTNAIEAYVKVNHKNLDSASTSEFLHHLHTNSPIIQSLAIAVGTTIRFVDPLKGNRAAIGLSYPDVPDQWPQVKRAIDQKIGTLVGPINLVQGGSALVYRKPIFIDDKYWGIASVVFRTDSLFAKGITELAGMKYHVAIRLADLQLNQRPGNLYGNVSLFSNPETIVLKAPLHNAAWEYAILPKHEAEGIAWIKSIRIVGVVFILFLSFIFGYSRKLRLDNLKNQKKLREILRISTDVIWVFNIDQKRYTYCSPSILSQRGYTPDEILESSAKGFISSEPVHDTRKKVEEFVSEFRRTGEEKNHILEVPCQHKDGRLIWIESSINVRQSENGELELFGISRNIDDWKTAQEELKRSEARLKAIINTTLTGLAIFDRQGQYVFVNPVNEILTGYPESEVLGSTYRLLLHPDDFGLADKIITDIMSGTIDAYDGEIRVIHKTTRQIKWAHIHVTKYENDISHGDRENMVVFFQDITSQKNVEKQLLEVNAAKDRFFSIIAHDLRSPLNSLAGMLQLINDIGLTASERHVVVNKLSASLNNTTKLLEDLLTWARGQSGDLQFVPKRHVLREVTHQVFQLLEASAEAKQIKLMNNVASDFEVSADDFMLNTILRNLISNAIKFTLAGGVVEIAAVKLPNGFVEVSVTDSGIGIPSDQIDNLFDISKKVSRPGTNLEKGTGLGLILCKDFAERHGGRINVTSKVNHGSRFGVILPDIAGSKH